MGLCTQRADDARIKRMLVERPVSSVRRVLLQKWFNTFVRSPLFDAYDVLVSQNSSPRPSREEIVEALYGCALPQLVEQLGTGHTRIQKRTRISTRDVGSVVGVGIGVAASIIVAYYYQTQVPPDPERGLASLEATAGEALQAVGAMMLQHARRYVHTGVWPPSPFSECADVAPYGERLDEELKHFTSVCPENELNSGQKSRLWLLRAQHALAAGDPDEAAQILGGRLLDPAGAPPPDSPPATRVTAGLAAYFREKLEAAEFHLRASVAEEREPVPAEVYLATVLLVERRWDEALGAYDRAIEMLEQRVGQFGRGELGEVLGWACIGRCSLRRELHEDVFALRDIERAVEVLGDRTTKFPGPAAACSRIERQRLACLATRANLLNSLERPAAALAAHESLVAEAKTHAAHACCAIADQLPTFYYNYANALDTVGRSDQALEVIEEGRASIAARDDAVPMPAGRFDTARLLVVEGTTLRSLGRLREACEALRRACELLRESVVVEGHTEYLPDAVNGYAQYGVTTFFRDERKRDEAVQILDAAEDIIQRCMTNYQETRLGYWIANLRAARRFILAEQGCTDEEAWERDVRFGESLVQREPTPQNKRMLADFLNTVASKEVDCDRSDEALAFYQRARDMYEELYPDPSDLRRLETTAVVDNNVGRVLRDGERFAEGEVVLRRGIGQVQLTLRARGGTLAGQMLATIRENLAILYVRWADAAPERCDELRERALAELGVALDTIMPLAGPEVTNETLRLALSCCRRRGELAERVGDWKLAAAEWGQAERLCVRLTEAGVGDTAADLRDIRSRIETVAAHLRADEERTE